MKSINDAFLNPLSTSLLKKSLIQKGVKFLTQKSWANFAN